MSTPLSLPDQRQMASFEAFYGCLEQEMLQLPTYQKSGAVLALLMVSLRRSDRLAALLGESFSQAVDVQMAARIAAMLRPIDCFVLEGREACWLLLPGLPSQELAMLAVHRLTVALRQPFMVDDHVVFVRPTIGIACAPQHARSARALLQAADVAQQEARAANEIYALSQAARENESLPLDLESALDRILRNNGLTVVYQPMVELASGRAVAVEALVRWPQDDIEFMPTMMMIETAERLGQIESLTLHVINTALRARKHWESQGLDIPAWVNLSARMLAQKDLPQMLMQMLDVWDISPSAIGFEITESALIHDINQTTEILYELQQFGFSLAIDDFGTGYSSLAYLRRFPISELKIDRVFITNMLSSRPDHQIVQSIIDLGHNFGLKVIAEGVEEAAILPELQRMGCDIVQGYVYAQPMTSEQLVAWWRDFQPAAG